MAPSAVTTETIRRPSTWYIEWLARDTSYAPQPYQHLARIFREVGANDKANTILYAGRERQRSEASAIVWLGQSLMKWTVGYGIGFGYFRVLWWVLGLKLLGAIVLCRSRTVAEKKKGLVWCMWASFDWMLPLVELDPAHTEFISSQTQWRLNWFYLQAIAGYLLAAFAAGLAGLTQGV